MRKLVALCATAALLAACSDSTGPASGPGFRSCAAVQSITVGGSVSGSLAGSDCVLQTVALFGISLSGSFVDYYEFSLASSQFVTITLNSTQFDAVLLLFNRASGDLVDVDDDSGDGGTGTNSEIRLPLPAGTYVIGATSYDAGETGTYQLAIN